MKQINSYLTFNGNCREAMTFYQTCFGGTLNFMTIGESPMSEQMPVKMRDCIMHSTLIFENISIMATDMTGKNGLQKGNAVSIMLDCSSEMEIKEIFAKLSADGNIDHPLENTFFGAILANITDKYGICWVLHFDKNKLHN